MISASPRRLSVFKSVVERGGFNAAAAQLGIAQPSVGAHIRALESQIGQPLFHRQRGSRPKLTKAGEALYTFAVDLLKRSEEATHALDDLRKIDAHEDRRRSAPRPLADRYSGWLAAFAKRHPKAKIVTRIGTIEDVIELIREREVALGFFLASGPWMDFVPRSCRTSRCCWSCRRGTRWRPARASRQKRPAVIRLSRGYADRAISSWPTRHSAVSE